VSVTDDAIAKIKEMIVSGELQPGDRLPREPDLAQRLGLSRSSLREAVRALSWARILDVRQGDGTYVTSLESSVLLDAMSFIVDLHHDRNVMHILETRRVLEAAAAALAAQYINDDELAELHRLIDAAARCATIEDFVDNDLEFHRKLALASRNPVLASMLDSLASRTSRARIWRGVMQTGATERVLIEHRALVTALEEHRPDQARAWATVHIVGVEEWVRQAADLT
jgi:GntR family transcriptional regulator, transcriptional repressor for pyruvate dehydrogenase complex